MRNLSYLDEFKQEAQGAMFTKQQAISATLQILQKECESEKNSPEEKSTLKNAIEKAEFRYIDATNTETDKMLDTLCVARFTTQNIVDAINSLLFDAG